jgi:hypothetical protein
MLLLAGQGNEPGDQFVRDIYYAVLRSRTSLESVKMLRGRKKPRGAGDIRHPEGSTRRFHPP